MVDVPGPGGALQVHEDGGGGVLQLNHHHGGEVAPLVPGHGLQVDFFSVLYSTLLHLPSLRFHCVGGRRDRRTVATIRHWLSDALTSNHSTKSHPQRLNLILVYRYTKKGRARGSVEGGRYSSYIVISAQVG
jgi:hypothetical protein